MKTAVALIERFGYTPFGAFGKMTVADFSCYTAELPWRGNTPTQSCIPEGRYPLRRRESPIVNRTTGGGFTHGYEIADVPNRTLIMLHTGNTMDDLMGCIAPGNQLGWVNNKWGVLNSRLTFAKMMNAFMANADLWFIEISSIRAGRLPAPK